MTRDDDEDDEDEVQEVGRSPRGRSQRKSQKRVASKQLDAGSNKKVRPADPDEIEALVAKLGDDDQIDKVDIREFFQAGVTAHTLYKALADFQEGKYADAGCLTGLVFYPPKGVCKNPKCKKTHTTDELLEKSDRREVLLNALKTAAQGQVV